MLSDVNFDAIHHRFSLLCGEYRRKVLHHHGVCIDGRESRAITGTPGTEEQTGGGEGIHAIIMQHNDRL